MKKQLIHNHLFRLRGDYTTFILVVDKPSHVFNIQKMWFDISSLTNSITAYHEVIKLLAELYGIYIYRNDNNVFDGLWLVGDCDRTNKVKEELTRIINKAELLAKRDRELSKNRSSCIKLYLEELLELREYRRNYNVYLTGRKEFEYEKLLKVFIAETHQLKSLKKFNRYVYK